MGGMGIDAELHGVRVVQRLRLQLANRLRRKHPDGLGVLVVLRQHIRQILPRRAARQGIQMQRDRHQHALAEMPDRGHEDRPPGQHSVALQLRDMLVLQPQRIQLERRAAACLMRLDHAAATTGIAADGIDADGVVRRQHPGRDQRAQQRDGAGGVAAGIGHPGRRRNPPGLPGHPVPARHKPSPDRPGGPCWHPAASAHCCPNPPPGPPIPAPRRHAGTEWPGPPAPAYRGAQTGPCDAQDRSIGWQRPDTSRRRSRMPSPVVPASPSMKML